MTPAKQSNIEFDPPVDRKNKFSIGYVVLAIALPGLFQVWLTSRSAMSRSCPHRTDADGGRGQGPSDTFPGTTVQGAFKGSQDSQTLFARVDPMPRGPSKRLASRVTWEVMYGEVSSGVADDRATATPAAPAERHPVRNESDGGPATLDENSDGSVKQVARPGTGCGRAWGISRPESACFWNRRR